VYHFLLRNPSLLKREEEFHTHAKCDFDLLTRPAQLNVVADRLATAALADLCVADNSTEFYPLPACRLYLRDATEKLTLRTKFPEYGLRAYIQQRNDWTAALLYSLIISGPL
jgi:hypothetical protein